MNTTFRKTTHIALMVFSVMSASWSSAATYQATGFKVGEVDQNSAIVWMRHTQNTNRIASDSSCPGSDGYVRVRYSTDPGMAGAVTTAWEQVVATNDYTYQFVLSNLTANQTYYLATDTDNDGVSPFPEGSLTGKFHTAASATERMDVTFAVITGTEYVDRAANEVDGFDTHASILALDPHFIIPTGDTDYFDHDLPYTHSGETGIWDDANTPALARYRWNRHFALPRTLELYKAIPAYWCVDDHDILRDDCWPGSSPWEGGTLTFAEGFKIYKEQVPLNDGLTYRTKRWGKDLQIWITEGRLYRDESNSSPGTPANYPTMWGDTQKQWFKDTVTTNNATWKVLISPTPFIGPDYKNKGDNYAYFDQPRTYDYEGQELRGFMGEAAPADMFVVCGDRHWQYHAIDPTTKLHEFSCGPASDEHTHRQLSLDPAYQSFYQHDSGGFATVEVANQPNLSTITFRIYDDDGAVLDSWSKDAFMPGEDDLGSMTIPGVTRDANLKLQLSETSNDHIHVTGNLDLGDPSDDAIAANVRQTDLLLSVLPGETPLGTYTLVTYTGSLTGSFARVIGLPENAVLDYSTAGQINLIMEARIDVSTSSLSVPEGGTTNFGVRLTQVPAAETTVTVSRVSGDSNITVQSGSSLVFTTDNWMTNQYPVLAAAVDTDWDNGPALIRCSSSADVPVVDVEVTEADSNYSRNFELPWSETFENTVPNAGTPGTLDGQHGWSVSGEGTAVVQSGEANSGSQALAISASTASHTFTGNASNIWITLWARPVTGELPSPIPADTAAAFYVNTDMHLMAYDSTSVVDTAATVSNDWNKIELNCDYSSKVWNLSLNGTQVVTNFAFYGAPAAFQALELIVGSMNTAYADDIDITDTQGAPDADGDGLPDWWEMQYYGGATNADPTAPASNGVNTVEDAYIAGFNPTNPAAGFLISDLSPLSAENILQWQGVSGRVYTVYWTSNLLSTFDILGSNIPWTGGAFTDHTHNAEQKGFYKIEVEVE